MKLLSLLIVACFLLFIANYCHSIPISEEAYSSSQSYGNAGASGYADVFPLSTNIPEIEVGSAASSGDGGRAHSTEFATYSQGYSYQTPEYFPEFVQPSSNEDYEYVAPYWNPESYWNPEYYWNSEYYWNPEGLYYPSTTNEEWYNPSSWNEWVPTTDEGGYIF